MVFVVIFLSYILDREFAVPDSYPLNAASSRVDKNGKKYIRVKGVRWFTNLDYPQRHEELVLYKRYTPDEYPKYDNYDAINVNKTTDIPYDYVADRNDEHIPDSLDMIQSRNGNNDMTRSTVQYSTGESFPNGKCNGIMGVPITFLDKYNPEQFEIIGNEYSLNIENGRGYIKGKRMYSRIFIRRKA